MRSPDDWLRDIVDAAEDARRLIDRGRSAFDGDALMRRAAKNIVSEIGEAAKCIPDEVLDQISGVPWREVKGMRDTVLHNYLAVDDDVLWDTLERDVPDLAQSVSRYLDEKKG